MAAYRKLFARSQPDHPLTAKKLGVLRWIGECGLLIPAQLQGLTALSAKAVQNHLLDLYHLGLVERTGVQRSAFSPAGDPGDPSLLAGRAPTLYTLTKEGGRVLVAHQLLEAQQLRVLPHYGPNNALFLAHEVQIRDVRVWLERCRRAHGHAGATWWRDGSAAFLGQARPDALFAYGLPAATLVGLVEVDRGTEKSPRWWKDKFQRYAALFTTDQIRQATGHERGRVLVIAPDVKRRDHITRLLGELLRTAEVAPHRFFLTEQAALESSSLAAPVWRIPDAEGMYPLVDAKFV